MAPPWRSSLISLETMISLFLGESLMLNFVRKLLKTHTYKEVIPLKYLPSLIHKSAALSLNQRLMWSMIQSPVLLQLPVANEGL